jgi:Putative prokaryotic signal transducing protein
MSDPLEITATLTRVPSETEAAIVIAALEDEGIRAESDEYTSGLRAGPWNWVDIMVAEQDLAKAKDILAKVQEENDHIDWSKVDVGEKEDT